MLTSQNNFEKSQKLSNLASDAIEAEKDSPGFMEPGSKIKKKRGPKGPWKNKSAGVTGQSGPASSVGEGQTHPSSGPTPVDPIAELLPLTTQVTLFYSNFLVQFAEDEKARLDKQTETVMAHTSAVCLQQYFPNAMGTHASLIVLMLIVGQTSFNAYSLRQQNLEKLREEKRQREAMRQ